MVRNDVSYVDPCGRIPPDFFRKDECEKSDQQISFFLAIPTMFAATFYDLFKNYEHLQPGDGPALALSFAVSFVVGWVAVRWLIGFVSTHTLRPFAWYRLAVGIGILIFFWN